ncbi:MAG: YIP1 family protein [Candidatus Micrarchaeota archaeon]
MARIIERADVWTELFSDPVRLFASEKKRASKAEASKHLLLGVFIFSVLYAATFTLLPNMPTYARPMSLPRMALFTVFNTVIGFAAAFLVIALNYVVARAFGGRASFDQHFHLSAVIVAPTLVLYYVCRLFPGIGFLLALLVLAYYVFANLTMLVWVHGLTYPQAFAALFVPSLILLLALVSTGIAVQAAVI